MATANATPASANLVGNAFINQYYNVLHQSPAVVHRFYTDQSQLTRDSGGADGPVETVSTQQDIHAKIMSMDLTDFKAEIKSVVSQNSLGGGVLVMVTGSLSCKSTGKRNFVQTFFLAPQEKGYFVLNDVLRYVDEAPAAKTLPYSMANGVAESTVSSIPEPDEQLEGEGLVPEETFQSEEYVVLEKPEDKAPDEPEVEAVEEPAVVEVETITQETTVTQTQPEEFQEQVKTTTVKMSYASILAQSRAAQPRPVAPRPAPVSAPPQPATVVPPPAASTVEEPPSDKDKEGVYISNLPLNATEQEIESKFEKFGPVKPGSVQVRSMKAQGYCFAFLDFEDQLSASSAVEASNSIEIGGRFVKVEYKRAHGSGRGRGRDFRGEGRGYGDREGGARGGYGDRERGGGYGDRDGGGRGYNRRVESTDEAGFRRYDSQRSNRRGGGNRGGRSNAAE
ncbi:ras GTPase-activating protein-binding protein 1 [Selaginella moellendorffii]|uniref:ras GTPase-activating protein-binding protein 1 n=1 Tax=Selaginella moellendorffii TaxID=88036 RepID=UPI000D1D06EA|nr:ras GTPase-activating protein-binding protein 1 [Selaginella moellendorffii]XP_024535643.1 ras GTPase-activating protein-binding protein 1 [Selaginella moellendorffii]|eukprot:XP_002961498.2 ras GTPase-activating protein-binding protein 1 [Selaginella moellendorffii]